MRISSSWSPWSRFQADFLAATYPDSDVLFANGKTAMQMMGHWEPNMLDGEVEDPAALRANLGFFPFPTVEGGAGDPSDVLGRRRRLCRRSQRP